MSLDDPPDAVSTRPRPGPTASNGSLLLLVAGAESIRAHPARAKNVFTLVNDLYSPVKMQVDLGDELKRERTERGLSLDAAARAAQISQGYLHKLEGGRVNTPSPRVLQRLGTVLEIPYERLMALAGYVPPRPQEATTMPTATAPTNQELVRLLDAVLKELGELKHGQQQLAAALKAR